MARNAPVSVPLATTAARPCGSGTPIFQDGLPAPRSLEPIPVDTPPWNVGGIFRKPLHRNYQAAHAHRVWQLNPAMPPTAFRQHAVYPASPTGPPRREFLSRR